MRCASTIGPSSRVLSPDCAGQSLPRTLRHLEATTPVFARPGIVNLLAGCLLSTLANQGVQGIAQCAICPKGRLRQLRVIAASAHFVDAEKRALLEYLGVFGFTGARVWTPVADLSGGERRRLQLLRLLAAEPNVLLLDEPTNDLDIDTLAALEDLLDSWPGTLIVASHDRYLVERVADTVVGEFRYRTRAEPPPSNCWIAEAMSESVAGSFMSSG